MKSKWFWINLIGILVMVIQYLIDHDSFPQWAAYEALAIVVLNAIAGMIQSAQVAKLKAQLKASTK